MQSVHGPTGGHENSRTNNENSSTPGNGYHHDRPLVLGPEVVEAKDAVTAARIFDERGIRPVLLKECEKSPFMKRWQRGVSIEEIERTAGPNNNVGILLGPLSGGVVDIDLDCVEALNIAPIVLPPTVTFGRESRRRSHYLYRVEEATKTLQFQGPKGEMLVELRSKGGQTMVPPSIHPSGQRVRWDDIGEVKEISLAELVGYVEVIAACALMAQHWPQEGGRHDAAMAFAGMLARAGVPLGRAEQLLEEVAHLAGDEEHGQRRDGVARTYDRFQSEDATTGFRTLARLVPEAVAKRLSAWLRFTGDGGRDAKLRADILVSRVRQGADAAVVYNAAAVLAALPAADYANVKRELKELKGDDLNLNDLERAVNEGKSRGARIYRDGVLDHAEDRPRIVLSTDRSKRDIQREVVRLLEDQGDEPRLFRRAGEMVRVREDERGVPITETLGMGAVEQLLVERADFVKPTQKGDINTYPPAPLVRGVLAGADVSLPPLNRVVQSPVLRSDGGLINEPGYHAGEGVLFIADPRTDVPLVPEHPTNDEVASAKALVSDDLFGDFPFADEASRANAVALLLTPFLPVDRIGLAPLAVVNARKRGSGKSKLVNAVASIATGRDAAPMVLPAAEDELRKQITSILHRGSHIVLIDNVNRPVSSASLEALLTATTWSDRVLGQSKHVALPNTALWSMTGNNVVITGDLRRRFYEILLDAKTSKPWARTGFRHPDLEDWVSRNRGRLIAAALTLCRAYFAAGAPDVPVPTLGSYERWARTMGGILAHAGIEGFLANLPTGEDDDEDAEWMFFLEALRERYGGQEFMVRDVVDKLLEPSFGAGRLRNAVPSELALALNDPAQKLGHRIGSAFKRQQEARYGDRGLRLESGGCTKGARRWRVAVDH